MIPGARLFRNDSLSSFRPAVLGLFLFCSCLWSTPVTGEEGWSPGFATPGVNDVVEVMGVYDGRLILGGRFTYVGDGVPANHIVAWDGSTWAPLGDGLNAAPLCFHVDGTDLYVGGWFTEAGGQPASYIARWDGQAWHSLGAGLSYLVQAIETHDGDLIVGGEFTSSGGAPIERLARWNGTAWEEFQGGADATVRSLDSFDGDLYVGGYFENIGGIAAQKSARWNGTAWEAMPGWPTNSGPSSFQDYQGSLYSSGIGPLMVWDGAGWVDTGFPSYSHANDLTVFDGKLITTAWSGYRAYAWDGSTWTPLGANSHNTLTMTTAAWNGDLYVGGYLLDAEGVPLLNVARWDGAAWSGLGPPAHQAGLNGVVYATCFYGGDLIAGGDFTHAGDVESSGIARWDGDRWHPLESGVSGWNAVVRDLFVYDGALIAGGEFQNAGGRFTGPLARWDGESWSSIGSPLDDSVYAITEHEGRLIVGGHFRDAGATSAHRVAAWDGFEWSPLGTGFDQCGVRDLVVHDGELYAGGCFESAGGIPTVGVAFWTGYEWLPLGDGINTSVKALASYNGFLIVGGYFSMDGAIVDIARWDGLQWGQIGGFINGGVEDMLVADGLLFAGGNITYAGGISCDGVAVYDGYQWDSLGSGVTGKVMSISAGRQNGDTVFFAGGEVYGSGDGLLNGGIARYLLGPAPVPEILEISDISNDQGGQVRIRWAASAMDGSLDPGAVTGYSILRSSDDRSVHGSRLDGWDYISVHPAYGEDIYQCVVPTLYDSTIVEGLRESTFLIRANTGTPTVFYDSEPASGYSVDNLAPSAPTGFQLDVDVLVWAPVHDPDFDHYSVYASSQESFIPETAALIATTIEPEYRLEGISASFFHVRAFDHAGNSGPTATATGNASTGAAPPTVPVRTRLVRATPNPFNPATTVIFDLATSSDVVLKIHDARGRLMRTLAKRGAAPGRHAVTWDGRDQSGKSLSAGVYFINIEPLQEHRSSLKVVLAK